MYLYRKAQTRILAHIMILIERNSKRAGSCPYHHGLVYRQVREKHVILHDVAGHLPERAQVPWLVVNQYLPFHTSFPTERKRTYWS